MGFRREALRTELPHESFSCDVEIAGGLRARHARLKAREHDVVDAVANGVRDLSDGRPEIHRRASRPPPHALKTCGHDANDSEWRAIERNGPSDQAGVTAELRFPEAIAQNGHVRTVKVVLVSSESAAERGLHSQRSEERRVGKECISG